MLLCPLVLSVLWVHKYFNPGPLPLFKPIQSCCPSRTQFSPEGEPLRTDAPHFGMGQDCLWDSEKQDWEWTAQLICSSFWYGSRLPLGQRGAKQILDGLAQICCSSLFRGSLVPYKNEEQR